jgi:hypothetical protein
MLIAINKDFNNKSNKLDKFKTQFGLNVKDDFTKRLPKFKSRIPGLIRKHLFHKKSKLDIFYGSAVLNME